MTQSINDKNVLKKINKSVCKFLIPLAPQETYELISEEGTRLTNSKWTSIILKENRKLKKVYTSLPTGYHIKNRRKGNTYTAMREGKIVVAAVSDTARSTSSLKELGVKWTVFAPLIYQKKSIGALVFSSTRKITFTKQELASLEVFTAFAALAIRKSQLYTETKKALEIKDLFIATAAHELRTPLTTISGYLQLIRKKLTDTNAVKWIETILSETGRLTDLVNQLNRANRVQSGKMEYKWKELSLRLILEQALEDFSFSYRRRKIEFNDELKDQNDKIIGDQDKLIDVIFDILDNAAKFSEATSTIQVKLFRKRNEIGVAIQDEGKGIEKEHLNRIFDGFYKTPDNFTEGIGVGLFLAKHIIEKHGGKITISSKENEGTKIEIYLKVVNYERKK